MTPKISIVTAVAAALAVVPAGWGQGQPADAFERAVTAQSGSTPIVSPDAVDRAVAARLALQSAPTVSPDAVDRMKAVLSTPSKRIIPPDAFERAVAATADYGNRRVFDDRFNVATNVPVASSSTSSSRELEWPQIGMGFGLGILLALGLFVVMRHTRIRTLAH